MIACLIMCHKNGSQVIRLAKRLYSSKTEIFIHADSAMEAEDFRNIQKFATENATWVHLTDNRLHGVLDTRSLVDIAMELIFQVRRQEQNAERHFQYYCLLSGQDYPIKPIDFIIKELEVSYPKPFIDCTAWRRGNWLSKKFSKNQRLLQFREWVKNTFKEKSIGWCAGRGIGLGWRLLLQFLKMSDYDWFRRKGIQLYGGSAWWILPDTTVEYVVHEYEKQPEYVQRLLKTYTPEETFFQILAKRGPNGEMIELNKTEGKIQECKTWAYFTGDGKPFVGHPYVITEQELPFLISSPYWFARKFEQTVNKAVLDSLDELAF